VSHARAHTHYLDDKGLNVAGIVEQLERRDGYRLLEAALVALAARARDQQQVVEEEEVALAAVLQHGALGYERAVGLQELDAIGSRQASLHSEDRHDADGTGETLLQARGAFDEHRVRALEQHHIGRARLAVGNELLEQRVRLGNVRERLRQDVGELAHARVLLRQLGEVRIELATRLDELEYVLRVLVVEHIFVVELEHRREVNVQLHAHTEASVSDYPLENQQQHH